MNAAGRPVVIDTDPGIDDAVAILCALNAPEFDIRGITTVAGNIGIATTTRNAGRILALAGRGDVPVISGASGPLERKGFDVAEIHGEDGLGGVAFPEPIRPPQGSDAAHWLARLLDDLPPQTLDVLALGPLTNLARLVIDRPDAALRLRRVVAMGGAISERGNVGPRAEFNIAADPEAARIVLSAGLPLTLVPLEVTRRVRASRAWTRTLRDAATPAAIASADLIDAYFQSTEGGESRPLHDPCVMLLALKPEIFGCVPMRLSVDIGHGADAGALDGIEAEGGDVAVAMTVDATAALDLLAERLSRR